MSNKELGIIGIGNMGTALLKGILNSKIVEENKIIIFDTNENLLNDRSQEFNVDTANNNIELAQESKYILIAVKLQVIDSVLKEISSVVNEQKIIVSIAAGITINHIEEYLNKKTGIIRIMPNTPALVSAGASAMSYNKIVNKEDLEYIKNILNSVGIIVELDEKYIDAVTGLSGSGPAYFFMIIEALADGGVKMGLPRNIALKLAAQTCFGAAKMVLETNEHPGKLKDMVTSPGGTTITALHVLEKGKLRATLIKAVEAATLKSKSIK